MISPLPAGESSLLEYTYMSLPLPPHKVSAPSPPETGICSPCLIVAVWLSKEKILGWVRATRANYSNFRGHYYKNRLFKNGQNIEVLKE